MLPTGDKSQLGPPSAGDRGDNIPQSPLRRSPRHYQIKLEASAQKAIEQNPQEQLRIGLGKIAGAAITGAQSKDDRGDNIPQSKDDRGDNIPQSKDDRGDNIPQSKDDRGDNIPQSKDDRGDNIPQSTLRRSPRHYQVKSEASAQKAIEQNPQEQHRIKLGKIAGAFITGAQSKDDINPRPKRPREDEEDPTQKPQSKKPKAEEETPRRHNARKMMKKMKRERLRKEKVNELERLNKVQNEVIERINLELKE